jgi:hypothetical protein
VTLRLAWRSNSCTTFGFSPFAFRSVPNVWRSCRIQHRRHTYSSLLRANRTDIKGDTRTPSSRLLPGHAGYPYPSGHASKAKSPERCHSSSACVQCNCGLRTHWVLLVFPLCAYANTPGLAENIGDRTKWVRIDDANCAFFVPAKTQHLAVNY